MKTGEQSRRILIGKINEAELIEGNQIANTIIKNRVIDIINTVFSSDLCVFCGKKKEDHKGPCKDLINGENTKYLYVCPMRGYTFEKKEGAMECCSGEE